MVVLHHPIKLGYNIVVRVLPGSWHVRPFFFLRRRTVLFFIFSALIVFDWYHRSLRTIWYLSSLCTMYDDVMMCPSLALLCARTACLSSHGCFPFPFARDRWCWWLYYVHRSALAFCLTTPPAQWNTFFTLYTPANNGVLRVYDDREKYGAWVESAVLVVLKRSAQLWPRPGIASQLGSAFG